MWTRSKRGNMLALIAAFSFIIILILFFALGFARMLGSSSEQKTAIEAAALAGARELSKIVMNTDEFGYIGLSDSAPNGTDTVAVDNFPTEVHSINTLIGTARLDMIIAEVLGTDGNEMKELALQDLNAALTRADELISILDGAIQPSGSAMDKDGNTITPYVAAETAYTQNQIRMTGSSSYVAGSLVLSLGALQGGAATTIPIPKPDSPPTDTSLDTSNTVIGRTYDLTTTPPQWVPETFYRSYIDIPFDSQSFVFAGIGDSVRLVDPSLWRSTLPLPYCHRTILKAEAQQDVQEQGTSNNYIIKGVACAQPASVMDPRPAPGALQISFPDGVPGDLPNRALTCIRDLYTNSNMNSSAAACDYYKCNGNGGDYPIQLGSTLASDATSWPIASDTNKRASNACKIAVYDWIRRAGTRVNVSSIVGIHDATFDDQGADVPWGGPPLTWPLIGNIPRGITHFFRVEPDGLVSIESAPQKPIPYYVVADQQAYVESFLAIEAAHSLPNQYEFNGVDLPAPLNTVGIGNVQFTDIYDMYIRMYCRRPGKALGGIHAGEPMDNNVVAVRPATVKLSSALTGGSASVETTFVSGKGAMGSSSPKPPKNPKMKGPKVTLGPGSGNTPPGFQGAPPKINGQTDFFQSLAGVIDRNGAFYEKYDATGTGVRWTYQTNGTVSDIRFRRCLDLWSDLAPTVEENGYVGEVEY